MPANVERMMFYGEVPWHGIGTSVEKIPTSGEAIIAAGLDWEVTKEDIFFAEKRRVTSQDDIDTSASYVANSKIIEDYFAIKRNDKSGSDSILGIVGKRYTPVQNKDAFSFFDHIVGKEEAIYHTAGSLDEGRVIWILAKLPAKFSIANDEVELYTLLTNRHDGTGSVIVQPTPIRVVCQNTLNIALNKNNAYRLNFIHTSNVQEQMKNAAQIIKHSKELFESVKEAYEYLAKRLIKSDEELYKYFETVIEGETKGADEKRDHLVEIFNYELEKNKAQPSLWIAYNSVTNWVDHERSRTANRRLYNAWLGSGYTIKQQAFASALDFDFSQAA